jgi:hypothetical protein
MPSTHPNPYHRVRDHTVLREGEGDPDLHRIGADKFPDFTCYVSNRQRPVKWFPPLPRCRVTFTALLLDMPDPHFEDDVFAGQRMVEIQGHGFFVNGINLEWNERPLWAWQFARIAYPQR